jgi:cytochrome c oxidase subunit I+III
MLARKATRLWTPGVLFLCAALALATGIGIDLWRWIASGLRPDASGQGAMVYALLSLEAVLATIGLLMAGYLSARNSRGLIVRPRNNSLDLCVLWITYAAGQGALTAILTRAFGGS